MQDHLSPSAAPPAAESSAAELAERYRTITQQLHGLTHDKDGAGSRDLRHLRGQVLAEFEKRKRAELTRHRNALLIGFVGRYNSGDELMLEMHLDLLRDLGFQDIDIWTELTADVSDYYHPLRWDPRKRYDLVVLGGGGLDVGYGFYQAFLAKLRSNARVILSSVNLPSDDDRYLGCLRLLADLVITRNAAEHQRLQSKVPSLEFLQDVSTLYRPPSGPRAGRVAMIIRKDPKSVLRFVPELPTDVLVLTRDDMAISAAYAQAFDCRLISLWHRDPREHAQALASYGRVISVGRFHAALYAAQQGADYVFLFPAYYKPLPADVLYASGRLSWDQIREIARYHVIETKIGLHSDRFAEYGTATKEQYLRLFQAAMDKPR